MESFRKSRLKTSANAQFPKPKDVNSPLAKYDSEGNLKCLICKTIIKSAIVWKAHVNSKQHKLKIEAAKHLQLKKPSPCVPPKDTETFEVAVNKPVLKGPEQVLNITHKNLVIPKVEDAISKDKDNVLPEKFFDDPFKDAKVRKLEYKNEQDEEWERFQKEIKEESVTSNSIIAGELTEATVDRQIDEIDEQMHRWTRVINLDNQIKLILEKEAVKDSIKQSVSTSDDSETEGDIEEYLNWRSKKF